MLGFVIVGFINELHTNLYEKSETRMRNPECDVLIRNLEITNKPTQKGIHLKE